MEQPIITAFDDCGALECCDAICPTRGPYFTIVVLMNNCVNHRWFWLCSIKIIATLNTNHVDSGLIYELMKLRYLFRFQTRLQDNDPLMEWKAANISMATIFLLDRLINEKMPLIETISTTTPTTFFSPTNEEIIIMKGLEIPKNYIMNEQSFFFWHTHKSISNL